LPKHLLLLSPLPLPLFIVYSDFIHQFARSKLKQEEEEGRASFIGARQKSGAVEGSVEMRTVKQKEKGTLGISTSAGGVEEEQLCECGRRSVQPRRQRRRLVEKSFFHPFLLASFGDLFFSPLKQPRPKVRVAEAERERERERAGVSEGSSVVETSGGSRNAILRSSQVSQEESGLKKGGRERRQCEADESL